MNIRSRIIAIILALLLVILSLLLRFLASRTFAFIFIGTPLLIMLYFAGFTPLLGFMFIVVHFISFRFIYMPLYKSEDLGQSYDEIKEINKECISHLKSLFKNRG